MPRRLGRPRLDVDEHAITSAYANGATILGLAQTHGVDRTVIRRVLDDHQIERRSTTDATVLTLPSHHPDQDVPDGYVTGADLVDLAGITYRQLDYWCRTGYLHPVDATPGSGHLRLFPTVELALAGLVRRLLADGMQPRQAFDLARELLEHGHAQLGGIRIDLPQDL